MRTLVLIAVAGLVLLTGCSDSDDSNASAAETSPSAGTTPSAEPTGAATSSARPSGKPSDEPSSKPTTRPETSEPAAPAARFRSARAAVEHLLTAWAEDDRAGAREAAGPSTTTKMFVLLRQKPGAPAPKVDGCDKDAKADNGFTYICRSKYDGRSLRFYVNPHPSAGWRVENVQQAAA